MSIQRKKIKKIFMKTCIIKLNRLTEPLREACYPGQHRRRISIHCNNTKANTLKIFLSFYKKKSVRGELFSFQRLKLLIFTNNLTRKYFLNTITFGFLKFVSLIIDGLRNVIPLSCRTKILWNKKQTSIYNRIHNNAQ